MSHDNSEVYLIVRVSLPSHLAHSIAMYIVNLQSQYAGWVYWFRLATVDQKRNTVDYRDTGKGAGQTASSSSKIYQISTDNNDNLQFPGH